MTIPHQGLHRLQVDALREVANIASTHAATALSQLTDRRVMIAVPEFAAVAVDEIPGILGYADRPVVVVAMHMLGDVTGSLVFLMPEADAWRLCALLLGRSVGAAERHDPLARSSLIETGNILGGAYANAVGTLMGRIVMLSVPTFGTEPPDRVLARHRSTADDQVGLCIETRLTLDGVAGFGGHILLLPHRESLRSILEALRLPSSLPFTVVTGAVQHPSG